MSPKRHGLDIEARMFTPHGESFPIDYVATQRDEELMGIAIEQAEIALELGNYPVGAVLVNEKGDIWKAHADEHSSRRLGGHAERNVAEIYNRETGELTLSHVTMYTNLVPCVGCAHLVDQGELGMLHMAADRNDVIEATRKDGGQGGVRSRKINMPEILHDSPRTLIVVTGILKARSLELFKRREELKRQFEEARYTIQ